MIRRPRTDDELYAWHREALARVELWQGKNMARFPTPIEPECGWFRGRLVKDGQWVPARIWIEQEVEDGELVAPTVMHCELDGEARDPEEQWVWICRQPISFKEFDYMTKLRAWQRVNAPDEYEAARQPVDHLSTPILEK